MAETRARIFKDLAQAIVSSSRGLCGVFALCCACASSPVVVSVALARTRPPLRQEQNWITNTKDLHELVEVRARTQTGTPAPHAMYIYMYTYMYVCVCGLAQALTRAPQQRLADLERLFHSCRINKAVGGALGTAMALSTPPTLGCVG